MPRGPPGRGQSNVLGVVLLFGITVTGAIAAVAIGGVAITNLQADIQSNAAEVSMQQFGAESSSVGLGGSSMKRTTIGGGGTAEVRPDAGNLTVAIEENDGDLTEIANVSLGAVVTESDGTEIAFQGGGVWRTDGDASAMVSPPQYHYRGETLTFPIVRVVGTSQSATGPASAILRDDGQAALFPGSGYVNPLDNGTVYVTIQSEYHEGWYRFFEARSDGEVRHHPDNRTVEVDLTVPFTERFEAAATAVGDCDDDPLADEDIEGETRCVESVPSATPLVENRTDGCDAGDCTDLAVELTDGEVGAGVYYTNDPNDLDRDIDFDTTDGDVDIVVDTDVNAAGNNDYTIDGESTVTVYLNGDFQMRGNMEVNEDGDASDLLVLGHSDETDVALSGNAEFVGGIYAPSADATISGNGEVRGRVVAADISTNGNGEVGGEPVGRELELAHADNEITFLHVTENRVAVRLAS